MCAFGIVVVDPRIQILLQILQRCIQLPAEGDLVELLQDRFVEALANAVGLRVPRLGLGVP